MKMPRPTMVDFETTKIQQRPFYPPIPVGVSIKKWGKKPRYYGFGHSCENNSTFDEAREALIEAFKSPDGVLFHNGKFDLDVAETWMKVSPPPWDKVHDTTFLLFLDDPHQKELGLKPSAERLLGVAPEERNAVEDWLVKNQPVPGVRITRGKGPGSKHPAGAYIAFAPGKLVGEYANGDVDRTEKIFKLLWQKNYDRAMSVAYDRERRLSPLLLDMERQGVRVDLKRLRSDVTMYRGWLAKINKWLVSRLGRENDPDFNLDSGPQLVDAMIQAGIADPSKMGVTPKDGKVKTDKAAIEAGVTDRVVAAVLKYRAQLKTCLNTFMETWLEMAEASGGLIFTTWNQVKGAHGTRTGRLSSTPNFQNIPKEFAAIFHDARHPHLPKSPWKDLPALPLCRSYVIPYSDDEVLLDRDYSQQEPRILGHFEGGELLRQYQANPWIDYHDNAKDHLERIFKRPYERKPVKNINLGIIYGQGIGSLAEKNGQTYEETKELRAAIFALYPGLKEMYEDMRLRAKSNEPIRTWGGREYYCEPPAIVNGRIQHFDYKMVNVLIQGSAADCTKEAIIRFYQARKSKRWRLLLQVHDELLMSAPRKEAKKAMDCLRVCMESVEFDVKILSEGAYSNDNWADLVDYDKKGKVLVSSLAA